MILNIEPLFNKEMKMSKRTAVLFPDDDDDFASEFLISNQDEDEDRDYCGHLDPNEYEDWQSHYDDDPNVYAGDYSEE